MKSKVIFSTVLSGFLAGSVLAAVPVVDVREFGATPSDDQDDTVALQQAVNAWRDSGGGVLYLPPGKYDLSATVNVSGVTGGRVDGTGAILCWNGLGRTEPVGWSFVGSRDVVWNGGTLRFISVPGAETPLNGFLAFTESDNVTVRDARLENVGVRLERTVGGTVVNTVATDGLAPAVFAANSKDIRITDSKFEKFTSSVIALSDCQTVEMNGCRINLALNGISLSDCIESVIRDCRIVDTVQCGILATGRIRELVILDNFFSGNCTNQTINSVKLENALLLGIGRAAIVVTQLGEKLAPVDGDQIFEEEEYAMTPDQNGVLAIEVPDRRVLNEWFPRRRVRVRREYNGEIEETIKIIGASEWDLDLMRMSFYKEDDIAQQACRISLSIIASDVEVTGNRISDSGANAIYFNSVYRGLIRDNTIHNGNWINSDWTGTMIEVFNGSYLHCDGNFLLDDRTVKRHGIPIKVDAKQSRETGTRAE